MTLDDFKDWLFEVLNDMDGDMILDIEALDQKNIFQIRMMGGRMFEIECRQAEENS